MRRLTPRHVGAEVGEFVDPFRRRYVQWESGLEDKVANWLAALPSTADLREQQLARYRKGLLPAHTFLDFVVTRTDGSRIVYAVRHARDADDELRDVLRAVADHEGDGVADEFRILRETDLDRVSIDNARLVCRCARDFDRAGVARVEDSLPRAGTRTTFRDVARRSGIGARGYRAAVALVQSGLVRPDRGERIRPDAGLTVGKRTNFATA